MTDQQSKKFHCPRCGLGSDLKANVTAHLNNVTLCEPKISGISKEDALKMFENERRLPTINCQYCDKLVTRKSLARHFRVCTQNPNQNAMTEQENTEIEPNISINELRELLKQTQEENSRLIAQNTQLIEENNKLKEATSSTTTNIPRPKYAKGKITQAVKIACWNTYIGKTIGATNCLCCKNIEITQHNFECGHVIAECDGGTLAIDNLRPICNKCNNSMGSMNMREFIEQHKF